MSVIWRILLQNSIICGFPMSTYSNSGCFLSRFRLMPMRVFFFGFLFRYFTYFSACRRDRWRPVHISRQFPKVLCRGR